MKPLIALLVGCLMSQIAFAEDIYLPEPNKTGKTTLMQALEDRHSDRTFAETPVDERTLSTVLWTAFGVNRSDGKRTIPTALDKKDLSIYVFNRDGIWLYDADNNLLKQVSDQNRLDLFQTQDYMSSVSTVLVYTGSAEEYAAMHAGSAYQNVNLFAAANNMASIVRGYFDKEQVAEALALPKDQRVIISQAIGFTNNSVP